MALQQPKNARPPGREGFRPAPIACLEIYFTVPELSGHWGVRIVVNHDTQFAFVEYLILVYFILKGCPIYILKIYNINL